MGRIEVQRDLEYGYADLQREEIDFDLASAVSQRSLFPQGTPLLSWRYRRLKRCIDIVCGLIMAAVSLPPCLVIAALIVLTSKGPVFYTETRIGQGRKPFRIWKFRSMTHHAPWHSVARSDSSSGTLLQWRVHKPSRDPRVTRVGAILRSWSLDELPQILNVLRGDMSLIGPRPVTAVEVPLYGHLQHFYLAAVPGLSGLWQVSGRSDISFANRSRLDANYVENWSIRKDIEILLRTVPAVLRRVGAR